RRGALEIRAGDAVDAAGIVAGAGEPRRVCLGAVATAQRGAGGRLVFRRGLCRPGAGKSEPCAVAMDHGTALRHRPMADGGHSLFCVRGNRCRRLTPTTRRSPMTASTVSFMKKRGLG